MRCPEPRTLRCIQSRVRSRRGRSLWAASSSTAIRRRIRCKVARLRPKRRYRRSLIRWLAQLDDMLRIGTSSGGLEFRCVEGGDHAWADSQ